MKHALLVALMALLCGNSVSYAQSSSSRSDSTLVDEAFEKYEDRVRYGFLVDPFSIYSSTFGFGIRGLGTLYNVPFTGSRLRATLRPHQRRGLYGLTLRSHDPAERDIFGLFRVRFESNDAYRFYGVGAGSEEDDRLFIDMNRFEVLARLGVQFGDDRYMIQPLVQYVRDKVYGIDEDDDPSVLDLPSQENLAFALGEKPGAGGEADNTHSGVKIGVSFSADFRNRTAYPTSGALVNVTGLRYLSQSDLDVEYDQVRFDGHAFFGIGGEHVLAVRALVETTDRRGDDPIPFFLLPEVDYSVLGGYKGHRLADNDMLVLTAEYRWPVVNLADLYQVSGFVQAGVGSVFEDISDLDLDVSFSREVDPDAWHGLRPGFGVGLRVAALEKGRDLIYWMLGVGPEGVTLASFRFVHSLTDIQ